ncbi:MAG: hypothetical protein LBT60_01000 [Oscillospiraceae bacterium]|jgi:hypothetical protein|nr:hypothetical protein [Oscillospiraceae bacterium]
MKRFDKLTLWITLLSLLAVLAAGVFSLRGADGQAAEAQRLRVEQAVRRAAVQCYALEGAYPPAVAYLQEHYGLHYDETRFAVYYKTDGSNLAPVVIVIQMTEDR